MWLLFLPVVWWAGAITACAIKPDTNLLQILQVLTEKLDQPFSITYTPYTLRCVFTFTIAYVLGIGIYYSQKKNYRRGVEHGSAKWGDAASICKRYRDKRYTQNLILTQNFRMGLDCYKHKRNLNVLVVGGSGAGKSRAYAVVNIMQCNCSMVVTDPKGELLRKTGGLLENLRYPENKAFEDTCLMPDIYARAASACGVWDFLYNYRIVTGSAMHRKTTLKTLDWVEAWYRLFDVLYQNGIRDALCAAYRPILTAVWDIWLHLTPEERKSPRMKEAFAYERTARHRLMQARGVTLKNLWAAVVCAASACSYLDLCRKRAERRQKTT